MRDKLLVLDAIVESAQQAALALARDVPPGKAAVAVTQRLHRMQACLFAARMELTDAMSAAKVEGLIAHDAR